MLWDLNKKKEKKNKHDLNINKKMFAIASLKYKMVDMSKINLLKDLKYNTLGKNVIFLKLDLL